MIITIIKGCILLVVPISMSILMIKLYITSLKGGMIIVVPISIRHRDAVRSPSSPIV